MDRIDVIMYDRDTCINTLEMDRIDVIMYDRDTCINNTLEMDRMDVITRLHGFLHVVGHSMITGWSVELRGRNGPAFIDYWPILAVSH